MRKRNLVAVAAVFGLIVGCSDAAVSKPEVESLPAAKTAVVEPCGADESFSVWCGYKNPEDLALTPDGDFLLATGFGGLPDSVVNEMSITSLFVVASYLDFALPEVTCKLNPDYEFVCFFLRLRRRVLRFFPCAKTTTVAEVIFYFHINI